MANYYYTVVKTPTTHSDREFITCEDKRCIIHNIQPEDDVLVKIQFSILDARRQSRFNKLLLWFNPNYQNLKEYLPLRYKEFSDNEEKLKEQMASIYEISKNYRISNIELAPSCYGCLYDKPAQIDHMECLTGCLHDPFSCSFCGD